MDRARAAAVCLARGAATLAGDVLERALGQAEAGSIGGAPLWAHLVDARLAQGSVDEAEEAARRVEAVAAEHPRTHLQALAALARGRVCLAAADGDPRGLPARGAHGVRRGPDAGGGRLRSGGSGSGAGRRAGPCAPPRPREIACSRQRRRDKEERMASMTLPPHRNIHMGRFAGRMASRIEDHIRPYLLPGERIRVLALAAEDKPGKKFLAGLISLLAQAFVEWPVYIVVTDQRFLAFKPSLRGEVTEVTISQPLSSVVVERFGRRLLRTLLVVRPGPTSQPVSFTFGPAWRSRAEAVHEALAGSLGAGG